MAHVHILSGFTHLDRQDVEAARRAALEAVRIAEGIDDETHDGTLGLALHLLSATEADPADGRRIAEQAADHLERAGDLRNARPAVGATRATSPSCSAISTRRES